MSPPPRSRASSMRWPASASPRPACRTHVTLLLEDYRDLEGQYDKLVSIEMVEAIGAPYLDVYFGKLGRLLKPDGLALVQAITIEDHRYAQALKSVDFIQASRVSRQLHPLDQRTGRGRARASDLGLIALGLRQFIRALTLKAWRERFMANLPQVRAQVSTNVSCACGSSTWRIAKAASANARSAWHTCCWRGRAIVPASSPGLPA
ncbi:MAG: class I SAM-dependent methyltransferase [Xanthomonadales bacterium]|nr:class I SAM-dependent methyltransferase [Xanthomonadales bacterium]